MTTFVTIGNSRFEFVRFIREVDRLAPYLPQPVVVQHGYSPFVPTNCNGVQFVDQERFNLYLNSSKLIITHGGATVFQAMRLGKVPVVIPRSAKYGEHVDDHQVEFAREMEKMGRVVVAYQTNEVEGAVARALRMQTFPVASEISPIIGFVARALDRYAQVLVQ